MATYASRRSSSTPVGSIKEFMCGKMVSSMPATNTVSNSRPFAAWMVISVTAAPSAVSESRSVRRRTHSMKSAKELPRKVRAGWLGVSPAEASVVLSLFSNASLEGVLPAGTSPSGASPSDTSTEGASKSASSSPCVATNSSTTVKNSLMFSTRARDSVVFSNSRAATMPLLSITISTIARKLPS